MISCCDLWLLRMTVYSCWNARENVVQNVQGTHMGSQGHNQTDAGISVLPQILHYDFSSLVYKSGGDKCQNRGKLPHSSGPGTFICFSVSYLELLVLFIL